MGLLAAVNSLLFRDTHQKDIIIGSPIAGREHADLEGQIGFYINTLPLRCQIEEDMSFNTLFQHLKQVTLGAYQHQVYPFDKLVEDHQLKRDMSRNALFGSRCIHTNYFLRVTIFITALPPVSYFADGLVMISIVFMSEDEIDFNTSFEAISRPSRNIKAAPLPNTVTLSVLLTKTPGDFRNTSNALPLALKPVFSTFILTFSPSVEVVFEKEKKFIKK